VLLLGVCWARDLGGGNWPAVVGNQFLRRRALQPVRLLGVVLWLVVLLMVVWLVLLLLMVVVLWLARIPCASWDW
jgi:hypothetical protein